MNEATNTSSKRDLRVRVLLDTDNWCIWYNDIKDFLGVFRDAGKEIKDREPFVLEKPMRTHSVVEIVRNDDGEEVEEVRAWKKIDDDRLRDELKRYQDRIDRYYMDRSRLWSELVTVVSSHILEKCRIQKKKYCKLQDEADTLGLYLMLFDVCLCRGSGENFHGRLRQQWHALKMYDRSTKTTLRSLEDFILEFNGLLELLQDTESYPTEVDQYEQFLAGINPERYLSFTSSFVAQNRSITVQELQDGCMRLEAANMIHHDSSDRDPSVALLSSIGKRPSSSFSMSFDQSKRTRIEETTCPNCGETGHKGPDCDQEKVKCGYCYKLGHGEHACRNKLRDSQKYLQRQDVNNGSHHHNKHKDSRGGKANNNGHKTKNGGSGGDNKKKQQKFKTDKKKGSSNNNRSSSPPPQARVARLSSAEHFEDFSDDEGNVVVPAAVARDMHADNDSDWDDLNRVIPTLMIRTVNTLRVNITGDVIADAVCVDSGATLHVFFDRKMVEQFISAGQIPDGTGITGVDDSFLPAIARGVIPNIGRFYVVPGATANLLSVREITRSGQYSVTFEGDRCIVSHTTMDTVPPLVVTAQRGTYLIRLTQLNQLIRVPILALQAQAEGQSEVETEHVVTNIAPTFNREQIERAQQVINLHNTLMHPSNTRLIAALDAGLIIGTSLTAVDVRNAEIIFGKCIHCIAGKITKPSYSSSTNLPAASVAQVIHVDIYGFTKPTIANNKYYLLCVDEFSGYISMFALTSKSYQNLYQDGFRKLISFYQSYKHKVKQINSDSENNLMACQTQLNNLEVQLRHVPPYQHEQRMERYVRTIKDRCRSVLDGLPYDLPHELYAELIQAVIVWINDLPNSLHPTLSPRAVTEGTKLDVTQRCMIPFGTLAMFHVAGKDQQGIDKFLPRSEVGIVLGPALTSSKAVRCYLFHNKGVFIRHHFTVLDRVPIDFAWRLKNHMNPVSNHFMEHTFQKLTVTAERQRAEQIRKQAIPLSSALPHVHHPISAPSAAAVDDELVPPEQNSREEISDIPMHKIQPSAPLTSPVEADSNVGGIRNKRYRSDDGQINKSAAMDAANTETTRNQHESNGPVASDNRVSLSRPSLEQAEEGMTSDTQQSERITDSDVAHNASNRHSHKRHKTSSTKVQRIVVDANNDHNLSTLPGEREDNDPSIRRSGRERKRTWRDGPVRLDDNNFDSRHHAYRISVREALSGQYAAQSRDSVLDEIRNMLDYQVGHYIKRSEIPPEHSRNILRTFMFIKHKYKPDGAYDKTKCRMVGDGSRQGDHMYDLISSSTVALTSVFMLLNFASYHRASLSSYDVKGAFLHAEFKEGDVPTYIVIGRDIAELWIILDPSAKPYLTERGELFLLLDKFIYGLKQAPLKFEKDLHEEVLLALGYQRCLHDDCLFTKSTQQGFSIVSTHVDDILQAATYNGLVKELRAKLIKRYKHVTYHANADSYLGMTIEQSPDRHTIVLSQKGMIKNIIDKHAEEGMKAVNTPAAPDLFDVNSLDEEILEDYKVFLSVIMTLMYLARLTRPDLLLAVTYLASRAHAPTKNDARKLRRVICYLIGTPEKGLTIQCDNLTLNCYCDASYGVHIDGRSHSGYFFSYGIDNNSFIHARSFKQKLTAISSTDAEIIAGCTASTTAVCLLNTHNEIHSALGNGLLTVRFHQDNKSAIWLYTEPSRYRRSKHILVKISYIRELIATGVLTALYLDTDNMIGDVLTKPKQGEAFVRHIASIMD